MYSVRKLLRGRMEYTTFGRFKILELRRLNWNAPQIGKRFTRDMDIAEFEKIIEDAKSKIPERFKEILEKEDVQLHAREKAPEILQNKSRNKLIFGVFIGVPYNKRSVFNVQQEPTRIELYKKSFETAFSAREDMEKQIVKTVIHEVGHYFGFSEEELRRYMG